MASYHLNIKERYLMEFNAVATCLFGLEKIVEFELKKAGANNLKVNDGRVFFSGDSNVIAKTNLWSRSAERILIILNRYLAIDFDSLFEGVIAIDWSRYIEKNDAFPVKGYTVESQLSSVPAMQSVIKKAIVEKLKIQYGISHFSEDSGVTKAIRFSMIHNECCIMLDTSGDGLHKRGYRRISGDAPIKETLAAGIVDLARVKSDSMVQDPFCGSATLLIEAALKAKNIAPGISRQFAAEKYSFLNSDSFSLAREEAKDSIIKNPTFLARGSDIDKNIIPVAKICAKNAGVDSLIKFEIADATTILPKAEEIIITNPPYGERMMSLKESEILLKDFFRNLRDKQYKGLYVISSNADFENVVKRTASKRRKMYNGMIQCNLFMYF